MSWGLPIIACTLACLNAGNPTQLESVMLRDQHIRVADIVDLSGFNTEARDHISDMVILTLTSDIAEIDISREVLATRARQRVPALASLETLKPDLKIRFKTPITETSKSTKNLECAELVVPRARGQLISGADIGAVACRSDKAQPAVRYDKAHGVVRAKADLAANTYLGRLSVPDAKHADQGDELVLRVVVGPVTIEKPVWALQPSNDAERIFVVDSEGALLRVPILSKIEE